MNYCLGFLFNDDLTKVALIKKDRPAWQKGLLNGIGGKLEPGEMPVEAMIREFREETGVETPAWLPVASMEFAKDGKVFVFTARQSCTLVPQPGESEQCGWFPIAFTEGGIGCIPNLAWLIPLARLRLSNDEWEERSVVTLL